MTRISASEAKLHFGALIDKAQREPLTIEKQGRPVAVIVSYDSYTEQHDATPSATEKENALRFLDKWVKRPATSSGEKMLEGDIKARAIWDKYTASA